MTSASTLHARADELINLRLMADMLREALDLPEGTPVSRITAEARTAVFLMQAEEAFASKPRWPEETLNQPMGGR